MSDKWKEGDILIDPHGNTKKILAICGKLFFMSQNSDHDMSYGGMTKKELDNRQFSKEEPLFEGYANFASNDLFAGFYLTKTDAIVAKGTGGKTIKVREVKD